MGSARSWKVVRVPDGQDRALFAGPNDRSALAIADSHRLRAYAFMSLEIRRKHARAEAIHRLEQSAVLLQYLEITFSSN